MRRKITTLIAIWILLALSIFCGCINVNDDLTQFSIILFDVEPGIINQGEFANISWVVISASSVSIDNGIGSVALTGHRIISPIQTTTYKLIASNSTTTKNATVTIIVNPVDEQVNLPFEIYLDKEEYLIGEPILITTTIKNKYNNTINIGEVSLEASTLDFEIINPENISLNYFGPTIDFVGKIQLQPNATIQVIYNLLNEMFGCESLNKYNFTIVGNHSIQGFYQSFATAESVIDIDLISNKEYFTIVDI